jgi:CxxC-x17-CxxC domain-containing protein
MSFAEKTLHCIDCGKFFVFSVEEQGVHASHGFLNEPRRCPPCRKVKKTEHPHNDSESEESGSRKQLFSVTCAQCGKATRVPFQPRQDKSVFCSDCYVKSRVGK